MSAAIAPNRSLPAMQHLFTISGMHCQSCVSKITAALQAVEGVKSVQVTLQPPRADVEMQRHIPLSQLNQAVKVVGSYSLTEAMDAVAPRTAEAPTTTEEPPESLYPLFLIVGYLLGAVLLTALSTGHWSLHALMSHFMGGFFLVFSFFKLLDLRGFAMAYRSYDVVARALPAWGFVYPFVELALGAAYLTNWQPFAVNVATLLIMLVGAVGVLKALLRKNAIRCACLGTVLKLPMTKVTLAEDLGMAGMAAVMLAL